MNNRYLIFDLEGTVVDPATAVENGVRYAMNKLGKPVKGEFEATRHFVETDVECAFAREYDLFISDAEKAAKYYMEYYDAKGIDEYTAYDKMPRLLELLKKTGVMKLALYSTAPASKVQRIIDNLDIAKYFDVIVTAEDGKVKTKKEAVCEAVEKLEADPSITVVIADRAEDIFAAREAKVKFVGVAYGYGGLPEMMEADADCIVFTVNGLAEQLSRTF